MPSLSESTRFERTRYLSSWSPSSIVPLDGPSRRRLSRADRLLDPRDGLNFRAEPDCLGPGNEDLLLMARSLFDLDRPCDGIVPAAVCVGRSF